MLTLKVVWGLCLAVAAMVIGIGFELRSSGSAAVVSYSVVVTGVLMVPLASAAIQRLAPAYTRK